jgi:hypothetical protein
MARGIGPPHVAVKTFVSRGRAACHGPCLSQRRELLVRMSSLSCEAQIALGGDCSCEVKVARARQRLLRAETCLARRRLLVRDGDCMGQRLVVRGGDCSEEVSPVENWSEMLPTSRERDVLPVMVLTGVLSPRPESWPSHCRQCLKTLSHTKSQFRPAGSGSSKGGCKSALVSRSPGRPSSSNGSDGELTRACGFCVVTTREM